MLHKKDPEGSNGSPPGHQAPGTGICKRALVLGIVLGVLGLVNTSKTFAQNQIMKAAIEGHVLDPQGLAVPGANVIVSQVGGDGTWSTATDERGRYAVYGLSPGRYRVVMRMPGFKDFTSQDLELRIGDTLQLDVTIQVAELAERVTVKPSVFQRRTDYSSPASFITDQQIASLNMPTVEDVFNYQPSIMIRRRYIGDSNGTIGMRGANMFQTARSMVFADGVPLWNPLQTRWNGAPRWSLVAPDEVKSAEVIYGPFSAEYSGNAMGGVVKLNTVLPTEREIRIDGNAFSQQVGLYGANEDAGGYRLFTSYGDRFGKFAFKAFYNHLGNTSQPQVFNRDDNGLSAGGNEPVVSSAFRTVNEYEAPAIIYGDAGVEQVGTDLFKFKGGYELPSDWDTKVTLAYEDRHDQRDRPTNYLRDPNGGTIWGDGNNATDDAQFNGESFNVQNSLFGTTDRLRQSLFVGWELGGPLGENWRLDGTLSRFDILKDSAVDSSFNSSDPLDDGSGVITAYDNTGWTTVDLKLSNPVFLGSYDLNLLTGYHLSSQSIGLAQYASPDYANEVRGSVTGRSGGRTSIQALFAQLGWRFRPDWELTLGARQEWWSSRDGYAESASLSLTQPDRDISKLSPKLSIGWEPANRTRIQYSVAKAYRFPIPEELFDNEIRTYGTVLGDATLEPEDGFHQNLSIQHGIANGRIEANVFRDDVDDTIFTQFQFIGGAGIYSFLPIDNVLTTGVELILDQPRILSSKLDVQVNATVLKSEIREHALHPSWVGNDFPRMPTLRMGLFAVYNFNPRWLASLGLRYSSNSFGDLANTDTATNVFGAMDAYLFLDAKLSYRLPTGGRFSFGVNNLTNDSAFVYHPWPQRTFFAEFVLDIGHDLLRASP